MTRTRESERGQAQTINRPTRPDDGNAFFPETIVTHESQRAQRMEDAEADGEEFVASAINGEHVADDARDEVTDEEDGGPFIVLNADGELPSETDEEDPDRDGHEPVSHEQLIRGARWASRGA